MLCVEGTVLGLVGHVSKMVTGLENKFDLQLHSQYSICNLCVSVAARRLTADPSLGDILFVAGAVNSQPQGQAEGQVDARASTLQDFLFVGWLLNVPATG